MALTITVNITDADERALLNDLTDIDDWVQKAVIGKINSCKKRIVRAGVTTLVNDPAVTTIPATDDEIVATIVARPDYKNRAQREAEDDQRQRDVDTATL